MADIVRIASEALWERGVKHDLYGCQHPELSSSIQGKIACRIAGPDYTFAFLVRLPKPRNLSILRGAARSLLRQQSRAVRIKGVLTHNGTEQGATSMDCTTRAWKRYFPVSPPGRGRSMRPLLNIFSNSFVFRAFIYPLSHECCC